MVYSDGSERGIIIIHMIIELEWYDGGSWEWYIVMAVREILKWQ